MAIDSYAKRLSIIDMVSTIDAGIPAPTGSIPQPGRQHFLNGYSGNLWASPAIAGGATAALTLRLERRQILLRLEYLT